MIQRESNLDHDILLPLSVKKVSRSYRMKEGKRIVLDNVSFSVLNSHCKCNNKRQGSDPWVYNGAYDNVH